MLVPAPRGTMGRLSRYAIFTVSSDLLGGAGDDDHFRVTCCLRAVVFEDDQVLGGVEHVLLTQPPR